MGNAEAKQATIAYDPFASIKVPIAHHTHNPNQDVMENLDTAAKSPKKSPAQQRLEDQAKKHKSWVYKNELRASPVEIRQPAAGSQSKPAPWPKGRRAQSARPTTPLIHQMDSLGMDKQQQITREQKLEREKEDFIRRVTTFLQGNVAIRKAIPTSPPNSNPRLPIIPPIQVAVPESYKQAWMQKLLSNREEALQLLKARPDKGQLVEPKTEADVSSNVERSLGSTHAIFSSFQRTITRTLEAGLSQELLEQLLQDDQKQSALDPQAVEQLWRDVGSAVEGVMQVYINRSNSRFIMNNDWFKPTVVDGHGPQAQVYSHGAETMIAQGMVGLLYIDTGHLVQVGEGSGSFAAALSTDLWQAVKCLLPGKVPTGQRLERVSLMGRHLLQAAITVEAQHGKMALNKLQVVLAVDREQEYFTMSELQQWRFFGLHHSNVVVLPLPRFPGFAQDGDESLKPVADSPKLLHGAGYAVCLLQAPAAAYTLDATASHPTYLTGSVLEWLKEGGSTWLYTGMFYDAGRKLVFDTDFLSGALYASEREGANMAVQVIQGQDKHQVRDQDSILLGRKPQEVGATVFACDLCASSMRTVHSYQVLQAQLADGFHVSTHRYLYKVSSLSKVLQNPSSIPLDLTLHGYYAYCFMKLNSLTCAPEARCAAVACLAPAGPPMEHAVLGAQWLERVVSTMAAQDKVDAFRQKAISLVDTDKLVDSLVTGLPRELKRPQSLQPKRLPSVKPSMHLEEQRRSLPARLRATQGLNVLLVMSVDHRGMLGKAAFSLARLAIKDIVDQLHVHVIKNMADSESLVDEVLKELFDKELDFNGQLHKSWILREPDMRTADLVQDSIQAVKASLVVVPDNELGESTKAATTANPAVSTSRQQVAGALHRSQIVAPRPGTSGVPATNVGGNAAANHSHANQAANSIAMLIARSVTKIPILVVKHNSAGRFAFGGQHVKALAGIHPLTLIVHLEISAVTLMVQYACRFLSSPNDVLIVAKTKAFELSGQPSMRANRMMVQAKLAASGPMKHEERMYAGNAVQELTQAAETECADIIMVSTPGEMPISKDTEELLYTAKSSILLFRSEELQACTYDSMSPMQVVEEMAAA